jgi:hypothetical protein
LIAKFIHGLRSVRGNIDADFSHHRDRLGRTCRGLVPAFLTSKRSPASWRKRPYNHLTSHQRQSRDAQTPS